MQFELQQQLPSIEEIKCPNCEAGFLYLKQLNNETKVWACPNCPVVFDWNYFDEFRQFEKFITRTPIPNLNTQEEIQK